MTRKVVSNTRSIVFFRRTFLLLFFRDSFAGNRRRRIPAVSRFKLKFTEHAQQNAPLLREPISFAESLLVCRSLISV